MRKRLTPLLALAALVALAAGVVIAIRVRAPRAGTAVARSVAAQAQPTPAPPPLSVPPAQWSARFRALVESGSWSELDHLLDEIEERAPALYRAQRLGYLHARAALGAGELAEAEERLAPYLAAGDPWRPLALWHEAELALATGRPEEAAVRRRTIVLAHPGSLYWQQALDAEMLALEHGNDPQATLTFIAAAMPAATEERAQRQLQAARVAALVAAHQGGTARDEGLPLLAANTHDDAAEKVALALDRPALLPGMSGEQLRDVADAMLHHRRWDRAVEVFLLARRELPPRQRAAIDFAMGRARFFAERYADAERLYRRAAAGAATPADRARALFHAGRAAQLRGQDADAEARFGEAIAVPGRFDSTSAALTARLRLRVHGRRLREAAGDLDQLRRLFPRDDAVAESAVALAMGQLAAGRAADARVTLGILPATTGKYDLAEVAYWRGRASEGNDAQGALAAYLEVLRAPVPTHFAFLARHRLAAEPLASAAAALAAGRRAAAQRAIAGGDAEQARQAQTDAVLLGGGAPPDLAQLERIYRQLPAYREVVELQPLALPRLPLGDEAAADERLLAMGLLDEAVGDLAARYPLRPMRSGLTRAWAYREGTAARASIGAVEALMDQVPEDFVPQLLPRLVRELLYPRYFYDTIEEQAARFDADPRLLLSIMREESRFNPRAKSSAAARGLMQLLLSTARKVALGIGLVQAVDPEDLYDPRLVIELGAKYVGDLQKQLGGDPYATAAAYNAGPTQAKLWLRLAPAGGHDYFLSSISFDETKHYVRKVLNSYERYGEIYQGQPATGGTRAEP